MATAIALAPAAVEIAPAAIQGIVDFANSEAGVALAKSAGKSTETLTAAFADMAPDAQAAVIAWGNSGVDAGLDAAKQILKNPGDYFGDSLESLINTSVANSEGKLKKAEFNYERQKIKTKIQEQKTEIQEQKNARERERRKLAEEGATHAVQTAEKGAELPRSFVRGLFGIRTKTQKEWQRMTTTQQKKEIELYNDLTPDEKTKYKSAMNYYGIRKGYIAGGDLESDFSEPEKSTEPDFQEPEPGKSIEKPKMSIMDGFSKMVPRMDLKFAKVVILVLFLIAIAVWVSDKFRVTILEPEFARRAAIGFGLAYLLLHTPIFANE